MNEPLNERRISSRFDRRELPRGGRRATDLPRPVICPNCGTIQDVRGLASGSVIRWCHCMACGEVWPWEMDL